MNWGVPDWRDSVAYPVPDGLTLREWWWQFTRRSPRYRSLWLKWAPINEARINRERATYEQLAARQGDKIDMFLDRAPTDDPDSLRAEFQMSVVLNPAKDFPDWILMQMRSSSVGTIVRSRRTDTYDHARRLMEYGKAGTAMLDQMRSIAEKQEELESEASLVRYVFDLSSPLGPQLKRAEEFLRSLQGHQIIRRPREGNWPEFLRVLDARDQGATFPQMAAALWPGQQKSKENAQQKYAQACQVRDNFPI